MARCLRCHAGNEWIEGRVPDEPRLTDEEAEAIATAVAEVKSSRARIAALEEALREVATVDEFSDGTTRLCWCRMPSQWATKDSGHEADCDAARALLGHQNTAFQSQAADGDTE